MISIKELQRRWDKLRGLMKQAGYEVMLVAGREGAIGRGFLRYITDWHLWGGTGYVIFPVENDPTLILGSNSQKKWARDMGLIKDIQAEAPPIKAVINNLKKMHLPDRLPVAGMREFMPIADLQALAEAFPSVELVDATNILENTRSVKSSEEIGYIKESSEMVAETMRRFAAVLAPGKTEREVVSEAWQVAREKGVLDGIAHISHELPPFVHPPTDRIIEPDDVIKFSIEMAGPSGYWIELSGVFSFKEPSPDQQKMFNTILKAVKRLTGKLRPGIVGKELVAAVEQAYREDGWLDTSRIIWDAHGIGLDVIEFPVIVGGDNTVLEENMVINVHPGLVAADTYLGFYIQDNYIVSDKGAEPLSGWERKWHVL